MADMTPKQAADEIRKGLRLFKAFEFVEDALDKLSSQEQLAGELEKRIERANAESALAEHKLEEAEKAVAAAHETAESIAKDAKQSASDIIAEAKAEARRVIDMATEAAKSRVLAIESEALREGQAKADLIIASAKEDEIEIRADVEALKSQLEQLKAEGRKRFS